MITPGFGFVPDHLLAAAELAASEGRLSWRCTDQHGRPANGGTGESLSIGEWSEPRPVAICSTGWHTTSEPHKWSGCRVWLVEGDGVPQVENDKRCWARMRPLAEVDPRQCIDARVFVRCSANLSGADLTRANLSGANLRKCTLTGFDLDNLRARGAILDTP